MTTILPKTLPVWLCITVWIVLGYSMILFNKLILSTWNFHYPFFLTFWHSLCGTILTQILSRTTNLLPGVKENKLNFNDYCIKIVPYAFCCGISLVLGNKAYKFLSLGYIQMLKAIQPVPLLIMYIIFGREKFSLLQMIIVLIVTSGVLMTSIGELQFTWIGFWIQSTAVMADCGRNFLVEVTLKDLSLDSLSMLYYSAPTISAAIFIGFATFEFEPMWAAYFLDQNLFSYSFLLVLFASGALAVCLNLAVLGSK
jgi:hypothetical protein